ncbi:transcription factor 21-like [Chironomus tepperi]|uniref:transcription factor 21-like n=1 Tax=Chironomus tepperi TaxID=113505 RepID=UPI00391F04E7
MKLKKLSNKKKASLSEFDSLENYDEDQICGNDEKGMPILRNTANARERARMRVLSSAFYRLKTIIPWVPHDTKLSKLDTLRLARNYIAYLSATLDGQPVNDMPNKMPHPQKMTWPYIFQVPEMSELPFKSNSPEGPSAKYTDKKKNSIQTDDESRKMQLYETFHNINMGYHNDSDTIYD